MSKVVCLPLQTQRSQITFLDTLMQLMAQSGTAVCQAAESCQSPTPLEAIIDSAVKTGAGLSQAVSQNYAKAGDIGAPDTHPGYPAQAVEPGLVG